MENTVSANMNMLHFPKANFDKLEDLQIRLYKLRLSFFGEDSKKGVSYCLEIIDRNTTAFTLSEYQTLLGEAYKRRSACIESLEIEILILLSEMRADLLMTIDSIDKIIEQKRDVYIN